MQQGALADTGLAYNHQLLSVPDLDVEGGKHLERPPVTEGGASPGGSLFVPFALAPHASKTIVLRFAWYVGQTSLRTGRDPEAKPDLPILQGTYRPWYAGRFAGIDDVTSYWRDQYVPLREKTQRFSDCFYDSTLPPEVLDAVAANLTILKSPTVLRQHDGARAPAQRRVLKSDTPRERGVG